MLRSGTRSACRPTARSRLSLSAWPAEPGSPPRRSPDQLRSDFEEATRSDGRAASRMQALFGLRDRVSGQVRWARYPTLTLRDDELTSRDDEVQQLPRSIDY